MIPRTREERNKLNNRETVEKDRLEQRSGGYYKYDRVDNVLQADPTNTRYYLPESHRFTPTEEVHLYERMDRDRERQARNDATEVRRQQREWRDINAKVRQEEAEKQMAMPKEYPGAGLKNKSGVPYDIVTQTYEQSAAGQTLKYKDDYSRYKGAVRATNLAVREHLGFNPVTGEQTFQLVMPHPPEKPALYSDAAYAQHSLPNRGHQLPADELRATRQAADLAEYNKYMPTAQNPNNGILNVPSFQKDARVFQQPYHQQEHWSKQSASNYAPYGNDNQSQYSSRTGASSQNRQASTHQGWGVGNGPQGSVLQNSVKRGEFFTKHHGQAMQGIFGGWPQ